MKDKKLTIRIHKPVSEVFAFTITPPNSAKWISFIKNEKTNEWPVKVGTIYSTQNDKGEWFDIIIHAIEQDNMFEMISEDKNYHVRYTFKPINNNTTEFEYYEWVDKGKIEDSIEPFTQATLEKLKQVLERNKITL